MRIEKYWLSQPETSLEADTCRQFEKIWQHAQSPEGSWIDYDLPIPKWEFLAWLTRHKGLLLHGSADADIDTFEPRKPNDRSPDDFSRQTAVFATGDGIWAIFYAILNRSLPALRFLNAAVKFESQSGELSRTHYFFSLTQQHLESNPWRAGTVYILPREGFVQQPPYQLKGRTVHEPHWACGRSVRPLARLRVASADFPLLEQVRAHDNDHIEVRQAADPHGFPWLV